LPSALVTGATGLLGSHLVERLLAEGWRVRALVRSPGSARWLAERGVELREGDVLGRESVARAAAGCEAVFHAAAAIMARGGWEAYRRANVEGTRNAVEAAVGVGARLLHVSSVAVYGPEARYHAPDGGATDEETELRPLPAHAFYARSKREAEALALDAHRRGRTWVAAVRPCVMYGPRDRQFVPRVARTLSLGVAPLPGGGRATLAVVQAANVADGAVRAAASDLAGGRVYNLANDYAVTLVDFVRLAAGGLGRRVRPVPVPAWLVRTAMALVRGAARVLPALSVISSASLDFLVRDNPFSSERARHELGWAPAVRPDVGVPEAFRWWRERHRGGSAA
jgi:nucleoside-diphosphate-sugar epimerase